MCICVLIVEILEPNAVWFFFSFHNQTDFVFWGGEGVVSNIYESVCFLLFESIDSREQSMYTTDYDDSHFRRFEK